MTDQWFAAVLDVAGQLCFAKRRGFIYPLISIHGPEVSMFVARYGGNAKRWTVMGVKAQKILGELYPHMHLRKELANELLLWRKEGE